MSCQGCNSDTIDLCSCDSGFNAFTVTTVNFVQPAVSTNVTITVSNVGQYSGKFATPGQLIYVQGAGYFRVQSSTNTQIVGQYSSEFTSFNQALAAAGATVTSGKRVSPGGEKGTTGATGSAAGILLYNDVTDSGTTAAVGPQNFAAKSYTLLANTLSVDDNIIEIETYITLSAVTVDYFHLYFSFGGTDIGHILSQVGTGKSRDFIIKAQISRIGANSQRIIVETRDCDSNFTGVIVPSGIGATQFTGFNTAIDLTIDRVLTINLDKGLLGGGTFGANEGIVRKFTVKNIKQ